MAGLAALDDVIPQIVVELPNCPEPVVVSEARNALIELCDTGLVWREDVDPFNLEVGISDYDVDTPAQARVANILDVTVGTRQVMATTVEQLRSMDAGWRHKTGAVRYFYQPDPEVVRFVSIPDQSEEINMVVAFAPTRRSNQVPAYLIEQYLDAIKYGAWFRLMSQPFKSWTDQNTAAMYGRMFASRVSQARAEAQKGRGRSSLTVQMKPF